MTIKLELRKCEGFGMHSGRTKRGFDLEVRRFVAALEEFDQPLQLPNFIFLKGFGQALQNTSFNSATTVRWGNG
jgi:hypothetical protein